MFASSLGFGGISLRNKVLEGEREHWRRIMHIDHGRPLRRGAAQPALPVVRTPFCIFAGLELAYASTSSPPPSTAGPAQCFFTEV